MIKNSVRPHPFARIRRRILQSSVLGALLAGSLSVVVGAPVVVSAAGPAVVATSASSQAFQRSAADRVAYLYDGSILVSYWQSNSPAGAYINQVVNPSTSPVSTNVLFISGGDEVSFYTLQTSSTSSEIWINVGSELDGLPKLEQVQHGTYTSGAFSWDGNGQTYPIPGALTTGRQDPSLTWNGTYLIAAWWDDTIGGNSDNIFYNWTAVRSGNGGWAVSTKAGTTTALTTKSGTFGAATIAGAISVSYATTGTAPAMGDVFEFGHGTAGAEIRTVSAVVGTVSPYTLTVPALTNAHAMNDAIAAAASDAGATSIIYTATSGTAPVAGDRFQIGRGNNCPCNAELRQLTNVTGGGPYTLTFAALSNAHPAGEEIRIEAKELSVTGTNSVQVAIRHSARLAATIAVYGNRCQIWARTLADGVNPSTGWSGETLVDPGFDDCEGNFGGPQITIDESNGNIHIFKAVTNSNSPSWSGVTYWLGHLSGGTLSFGARVIIDATGISATTPPDIAGAVDSSGTVYVVWATAVTGGAIKYATLSSPYTAASAITTLATTGANPRWPHIPAQGPLTGGYVPVFYQSGSGPYNVMLDTSIRTTPLVAPTGLNATANSTPQVTLTWNASPSVGVTGYTIYRDGVSIGTVNGSTLAFIDNTVGRGTYTYAVDAFDGFGNHSPLSAAVTISTGGGTVITGKPLAADFSGDGKTDLAFVTASGVSVSLSNGSAFATPATWAPFPFYGSVATLAGDVTGDGKADLLAVNANQVLVLPSTGTGFGALAGWSNIAFYGTRGTFLADVNGDGKADLVAVNNTSVWVMLSTGSGFGLPQLWSSTPFYGNLSTQVGDVTGDGKADLIAINSTSTWVMTSTGSGFSAPALWSSVPFYGNVQTMLVDANGDGKVDLVALNFTSTWIMTSTGTTFGAPTQWSATPFYGTIATLAGDPNGDHKVDLIAINNTSIWVDLSTGTALMFPQLWL